MSYSDSAASGDGSDSKHTPPLNTVLEEYWGEDTADWCPLYGNLCADMVDCECVGSDNKWAGVPANHVCRMFKTDCNFGPDGCTHWGRDPKNPDAPVSKKPMRAPRIPRARASRGGAPPSRAEYDELAAQVLELQARICTMEASMKRRR